MKIHKELEQRTLEWERLRKGKITGTVLKKIVGTKTTQESCFYEVLAGRLSVGDDDENPMDRGARLEDEALEAFEQETGKIVDRVGFIECDDESGIACSPDGLIENDGKYTEAVEIKCLGSANHLRAVLENEIPKDYYPQVVQYFIVNTDLERLYFFLYDPRITVRPTHTIIVTREALAMDIAAYAQREREFLAEVDEAMGKLVEF